MQYEEFLFCHLTFLSRYLYCQGLLKFAKYCMTTVCGRKMFVAPLPKLYFVHTILPATQANFSLIVG